MAGHMLIHAIEEFSFEVNFVAIVVTLPKLESKVEDFSVTIENREPRFRDVSVTLKISLYNFTSIANTWAFVAADSKRPFELESISL